MDVVGGLIVAAQSGKRQPASRGVKRHHAGPMVVSSCAGECGSAWVEQPWNRLVNPRRDDDHDCGGYELRSVLGGGQTRTGEGGGGRQGTSLPRLVEAPPSIQGFEDHSHHVFSTSSRSSLAPFYRPPTLAVRSCVQFLLRKELTVTDVGELGRIILPKRDAELHLPHLDNKEGILLKMEDYNSNKNWTLRYKWWPNNKSRMYVLESTGEFVKYYDLKEKDELRLYKDTTGAIIIQGHKWSPSNSFHATDTFHFKAKSTAKRSPRGSSSRMIAAAAALSTPNSNAAAPSNRVVTDAHTSKAHASPYMQAKMQAKTMDFSVAEGADCHLQLGQAPSQNSMLVNSTLVNKNVHPLDSGLILPGPSILSTSILSTSVLTTSGVSLEQTDIEGPLDGCIDWKKLPDPLAIEFGDPPVLEFPVDFEDSWPGDCTID